MRRLPLVILLLACPLWAESSVSLKILSSKGGTIMAQPFVTPRLQYTILAGKPDKYVYDCKETIEVRDRGDHKDDIVILGCAEGVQLELKGVYLQ